MIPLPALSGLLSGSSTWRKAALVLAGTLALLALLGLAAWRGYAAGYARAEDKGAAELERVRAEHAAARAAALAQALRMYDQAKAAAYTAEQNHLARVRRIQAENRELFRRISNAAQAAHGAAGGPCVFDRAFVRHVNQALGLAGGDRAVPGAPAGAPGGAASPGAVAAGVLPGDSGAVTSAEDLLAFLGVYGAWVAQQDSQLKALQQWARLIREAQP